MTSRKIGIHRVVQAPVGNFNRDDMGQPKTTVLGGVPRLLWSSQSVKRDARNRFGNGENMRGIRTTDVATTLARYALDGGHVTGSMDAVLEQARAYLEPLFASKSMADKIARRDKLEEALSKAQAAQENDPSEKNEKALEAAQTRYDKAVDSTTSDALVYVSERAFEAAAKDMSERTDVPSKSDLVSILGSAISLDAAAFGRMYAAESTRSPASLNTDATVQVAFSVSTGAFSPDVDFYTAMDDQLGVAKSMGHNFIGAPIMYTYMAIDVDALADTLTDTLGGGVTSEAFRNALSTLVRSLVFASPQGRKNGSAEVTPPSTVLLTVGDSPSILTSGFVEPVDTLAGSAVRLQDTLVAYRDGYGQDFTAQALFSLDTDFVADGVTKFSRISDALSAVVTAATSEA